VGMVLAHLKADVEAALTYYRHLIESYLFEGMERLELAHWNAEVEAALTAVF
jgi:hypothetical protein